MRVDYSLDFVFKGAEADGGRLQFYDASQALVGLERVVSLTNHLLLNGEVITQSPSAKGFEVFLMPPEKGSWKATLGIVLLTVGVASKDSALGYLAVSALDYVLQEALGFDVDFDELLGPQIEDAFRAKEIPNKLTVDRFDSLIEKVEPGLRQCHRPLVFSSSATNAQISWAVGSDRGVLSGFFDRDTFSYIDRTIRSEQVTEIIGIVSSYNANTFKGRLYVEALSRTVPFELSELARTSGAIEAIVGSLYENTVKSNRFARQLKVRAFRNESVNGRLKSLFVVNVRAFPEIDDILG